MLEETRICLKLGKGTYILISRACAVDDDDDIDLERDVLYEKENV